MIGNYIYLAQHERQHHREREDLAQPSQDSPWPLYFLAMPHAYMVRRVASLGKGPYFPDAGLRIGFVKRSYTASASAISFFRFGFSKPYSISCFILSLTAEGR